jgi:FKBP-type peptidyl-prolyl cis-trans isomerase 2
MTNAKQGDKVDVHYVGTLSNGQEFDSSRGGEPLTFVIGEGVLIGAFEEAIVDMTPGDTKQITIAAGDAYGEHEPMLVHEVARVQIPDEIDLQLGTRLQAQNEQGETIVMMVTDLNDTNVTLDANHPLAGKDLTFELELVNIHA